MSVTQNKGCMSEGEPLENSRLTSATSTSVKPRKRWRKNAIY